MNLDQFIGTPGALTGNQTYKEIVQKTYYTLGDPRCWIQEALAADVGGKPVKPRDPRACCWCLTGAIAFHSNELGVVSPELLIWLDNVVIHFFKSRFVTLEQMNDYVDHDTMLEFLRYVLSLM